MERQRNAMRVRRQLELPTRVVVRTLGVAVNGVPVEVALSRFTPDERKRYRAIPHEVFFAADPEKHWLWTGSPQVLNAGWSSVPRIRKKDLRRICELFFGLQPKGLHFHHACREPLCGNPFHIAFLSLAAHAKLHGDELAEGIALMKATAASEFSDWAGQRDRGPAAR